MDTSNSLGNRRHHGAAPAAAEPGGVASANGLTLSLPLPPKPPPPPPPAAGAEAASTAGGREDVWSQGATVTLIEAWGDRYLELNRGNLKQKHWKEVADAVNSRAGNNKPPKTDVQCKNRLDTLKKKYKVEKTRVFNGGATKWPLFNRMNELIGPSRKNHLRPPAPPQILPPPPPPPQQSRSAARQHTLTPPAMNNRSPDMTDSCLNGFSNRNNVDHENGFDGNFAGRRIRDDGPLKELAGAIVQFGEVYERIEGAKQQQMMDLEKQRMEFMKDLELQRMQLFMQTQLELAKIKHGKQGNSTEHYL